MCARAQSEDARSFAPYKTRHTRQTTTTGGALGLQPPRGRQRARVLPAAAARQPQRQQVDEHERARDAGVPREPGPLGEPHRIAALGFELTRSPEALRPLSLNRNLTHLALRGNPTALNPKNDYRVLLLDMIPSVLVLDDKRIRSAVKYTQSVESGGVQVALLLQVRELYHYHLLRTRLYDDKKQFIVQNRNRPHPGTKVKPLVAGDSSSKYDGTMFLQPAVEPSHERVRSLQLQQAPGDTFEMPPAP